MSAHFDSGCRLLVVGVVMGHALIGAAAEPQRLTDDGRLKFSPVFCNNGREIVFAELTDPTLYRLKQLALTDGVIALLHPKATTSEFEPAWATDGKCFAYLKTVGPLSVAIALQDGQGQSLGEIKPEGGFFGYRHPTLAPDHSILAYSFGAGGRQQIYSSRLDGTDRKALTNSTGLNHWPSFSPDGKSIAFGSSRDGNFEIYVMQSDGTDARRLTDHPLRDVRPRFSPDGRRIAFTSHRDGNAEIYIMNAKGEELQKLTDFQEADDFPDWHPDGKHIITVSERNGRSDLYLWSVDSD